MRRFATAKLVELLPEPGPHRDDLAQRAGYSSFVNMRRVLRRPTVSAFTADRISIALGLHPALIYVTWFCCEGGSDYEAE